MGAPTRFIIHSSSCVSGVPGAAVASMNAESHACAERGRDQTNLQFHELPCDRYS